MEGRGFRDLNQSFLEKGIQILGISIDTVEENAAFAGKFGFPYPLLCDTSRTVGMAYGACDSPDDAEARRITYVIGTDGRVRMAVGDVKTAEHAVRLLASLG